MKETIGTETDPRHHTLRIRDRMNELIEHLREDVEKIDEPQAKALFETSAEVIAGLVRAFEHYDEKNEAAWTHR